MAKEIRLKIDDHVHSVLKENAKKHRRTIISEILTMFDDFVDGRLTYSSQSLSQAEELTLAQLQEQGISNIKFKKPIQEKVLSPLEQQIKDNKLKDQRARWVKHTIDEILPDYKDYPNYETFVQSNIDIYWDKPDEDLIAHLKKIKAEMDFDDGFSPYDEDDEQPTSHSDEYIRIRDYFNSHYDREDFSDLTANARANNLDYIKDYYDIKLHDALGSPHSYDFSDEQWQELIKIITE